MAVERIETVVAEFEVTQAGDRRRVEPEPVTLVQFPLVWGRNVSPFSLKLETWLKLASIPYDVRPSLALHRAPKGKLPYILDGGTPLADSSLIIQHLKRSRGIDPDAGLTAREQAEAVALQRLFEDHLYFAMVYSRWIDAEGFAVVGESFFAGLPMAARPIARAVVRRRVRRMLHFQGLGRHQPSEIYDMGAEDLHAIAGYLGDKPFFLGERLTSIDAVAFGSLANILLVPIESELKRAALGYPNLVTWVESMEAGLSDG
jgi:glutathione S-transferase